MDYPAQSVDPRFAQQSMVWPLNPRIALRAVGKALMVGRSMDYTGPTMDM